MHCCKGDWGYGYSNSIEYSQNYGKCIDCVYFAMLAYSRDLAVWVRK
jgi:hypothetical protein